MEAMADARCVSPLWFMCVGRYPFPAMGGVYGRLAGSLMCLLSGGVCGLQRGGFRKWFTMCLGGEDVPRDRARSVMW
jgi:hypothetical protein